MGTALHHSCCAPELLLCSAPQSSPAIMKRHLQAAWAKAVGAMEWIAKNTPQDAWVYALFSPYFGQTSALYNTQRNVYFLEGETFRKMLEKLRNTGKIDRTTLVTIPSDSGVGFPYRKGLLSFGTNTMNTKTSDTIDICSANYYLIDKEVGDANLYLMQRFLQANMSIEYDGPSAAVLKNSYPGGDCVAT